MVREHLLDAVEMEPPEPLVRALEMVENLGKGDYLRMRHRLEPCLLYDNLKKRGFSFITCSGGDAAYEIFIWREADAEARPVVQAQADKLDKIVSCVNPTDP